LFTKPAQMLVCEAAMFWATALATVAQNTNKHILYEY